jgi:hypothetical protein
MNKLLLYKILLAANITIFILLVAFIIIFGPAGKPLFLLILMALCGCFGALAMYREIRKFK